MKTEKINVSGRMKSLAIGETLNLKRGLYKPSAVRTTAYTIKQDLGLEFTVIVSETEIKVERVK